MRQYQFLVLFRFFLLGLPIQIYFPIACFVLFLPSHAYHFKIFFPLFHVLFCLLFSRLPINISHYSMFCFVSPPSGLPINISHYSMFCFVWASPWKIWKWGRLRGRNKTHQGIGKNIKMGTPGGTNGEMGKEPIGQWGNGAVGQRTNGDNGSNGFGALAASPPPRPRQARQSAAPIKSLSMVPLFRPKSLISFGFCI